MLNSIGRRLTRLETTLTPPQPKRWLRTMASQTGIHGEVLREETNEDVITRHLTKNPEDTGLEFGIIVRSIIYPVRTVNEGTNVW